MEFKAMEEEKWNLKRWRRKDEILFIGAQCYTLYNHLAWTVIFLIILAFKYWVPIRNFQTFSLKIQNSFNELQMKSCN